ncbi:MAG: hypothetical protein JXA14_20560 [Anaerolineae bacterium]|nr:hypothetical protein [Anaerolineae bacterium]
MKPRSFRARTVGVSALIVMLMTCVVVVSPGDPASAQDGGERVLDLGSAIEQSGVGACCKPGSRKVEWWNFFQRTDLLGSDGHGMPVVLTVDHMTFPLRFDFEAGTVTGELEGHAAHSERDEEFEGTLSGRVVNGSVVTQPYGDAWEISGTILMDITVSGWRKDLDKDKLQVLLEGTRSIQLEVELDGKLAYNYQGEPVQLDDGGYYYPIVEEPNYDIDIVFSEGIDEESDSIEGVVIFWNCDTSPSLCTLPAGFLPPLSGELDEFNVSLGCQPSTPAARESVVCTVQIDGARYGETFEYHWYLDNASVGMTVDPSWTWNEAQPGTHDIGVQVVGEGRWADADFTLVVGEAEDLVVTIGMMPDPPLEGKGILLSAHVEGQFPKEKLHYNWFLDGNLVCEAESCPLDPLEGSRTVQLDVYGEGDRIATDIRSFTVAPDADAVADAGNAAGFVITDLTCSDGITSDETLVCTAQFERVQGGIGSLNVIWVIDGATAASASADGNSASWSLDQPAPGEHDVEVQVIDPATDMARVLGTSVEVRAGQNAMIPPIMQIGAAGGTLATVGGWLWWEWVRQRREAALSQDRQRWFDRVGEMDRPEREQRQQWEAEQQAMKEEYGRLLNGLITAIQTVDDLNQDIAVQGKRRTWKLGSSTQGLDDLLDFVERHRDDVCQDGVWDRQALDRLQESVRRLSVSRADRDQYGARLRFSRAMPPGLEALCELSRNMKVRILSDVLFAGVSEIFWTPLSALDAMWQAARAGKSADAAAWEGYKSAFKDVAAMVIFDRIFTGLGKIYEEEIEATAEWLGKWAAAKRQSAATAMPRAARWAGPVWDWATTPRGSSITNYLNRLRGGSPHQLPVIRHGPLRPMTYLDSPTPFVDRLNRLHNSFGDIADDVENLMARAEKGLEMRSVDMMMRRGKGIESALDGDIVQQMKRLGLTPGEGEVAGVAEQLRRLQLTPDEELAYRLMSSPRYQEAFDQGLIPRRIHELVNHTRDKVTKGIVFGAYTDLGPEAKYIARIEFTGTGARPHSPSALSGFTDLDLTPRADPKKILADMGADDLLANPRIDRMLADAAQGLPVDPRIRGALDRAQTVEKMFKNNFDNGLVRLRVDAKAADINMFPGLHARPDAPPRGGYGSPEMILWNETDVTFRARCAVPTEQGNMVFNAHPDVRPMPGQGPRLDLDPYLGHPERAGFNPERAADDVRRLVLEHVEEMPNRLGRQPTRMDIMRGEGKNGQRLFWVQNAGSGQATPGGLQVLNRMKSDRTWTPSAEEADEAWHWFTDHLGLADQLGGIR